MADLHNPTVCQTETSNVKLQIVANVAKIAGG
jgi:hypothetical protein